MPTLGYLSTCFPDSDDGQARLNVPRRDLDHLGATEPRVCPCGAPISPQILALRPTAARCSSCALLALLSDAEDGPGAHDGALDRVLEETL